MIFLKLSIYLLTKFEMNKKTKLWIVVWLVSAAIASTVIYKKKIKWTEKEEKMKEKVEEVKNKVAFKFHEMKDSCKEKIQDIVDFEKCNCNCKKCKRNK